MTQPDRLLFAHVGPGPRRTSGGLLGPVMWLGGLVATLVAIALQEGHIRSLDDKAMDYVPELRDQAYGQARLRDLLRMASGVKFDETYDNRLADIHRVFYKTFIFNQPIDQAAAGYPAEDPPGTRFHYKSTDTQILSWVVRRATGQTLTAYAQSMPGLVQAGTQNIIVGAFFAAEAVDGLYSDFGLLNVK